ncbi:hypothetical protein [Bacillus sp. FJAT-27986]|uniref:hypothetical protein n=1 Tax=Bacillus sp. FJAT-27986 TaxID=1743146 RepID=UPI00080AD645|nr:hypothetical protein [Bacillus sp. FJAT-27986]OCA86811.1 hypothetical protein A8L44_05900 [Bacillus sp. FJAT-27986]
MNNTLITADMITRFNELNKKKKEIEMEMEKLKEVFHTYFDHHVGANNKGELIDNGIKLQRQIRKYEKYSTVPTVYKLEELNMNELIKTVKIPDEEKMNAAIKLGFLKEKDFESCKLITYSKAISVKEV